MEPYQPIFSRPIYSYSVQANQSCHALATEGKILATAVDNLNGYLTQSRTLTIEEFPLGRKNSASFKAMSGNLPLQLSADRCFFALQLLEGEDSDEVGKTVLGMLSLDTSTTIEIPYHASDLSVSQGMGMTVGNIQAASRVIFWDLAAMKPVYQADCSASRLGFQSRCFILPEESHLALSFHPRNLFYLWDNRVPNSPVRKRPAGNPALEIEYTAMLKTGEGPRLAMTTKDSNTIDFMDLATAFGQITHQFKVSLPGYSSPLKGRVAIAAAQDGVLTTRTETELDNGGIRSTLCSYDFKRSISPSPIPFMTHYLDSKPKELAAGRAVACNNETLAYAYNGEIKVLTLQQMKP